MGEKSFIVLLGDSAQDRYRLYCQTEKGQVTIFRVQYEAYIDSVWRAIIRYDTSHGFPHRDLLHPHRPEEKTEYPNRPNADILTLGQEDIKRNWKTHRARYEQEMKK